MSLWVFLDAIALEFFVSDNYRRKVYSGVLLYVDISRDAPIIWLLEPK